MRKRFQADEYGQRMEGDGIENNGHLSTSYDKSQPINGVHSQRQGFETCNMEKYTGSSNNLPRLLRTEAENGNKSKSTSLLPDVARHFSNPLSYEESNQNGSQKTGYIRYLSKNSHIVGPKASNLQPERPNTGNSSYKENNILINDDDEMLLPPHSIVENHSKGGMDNPVALGPDQGYPQGSESTRGSNNVSMRPSLNVTSKMQHGWTDQMPSHTYRNEADRNIAVNGNNRSQMREVWTKLYGKTSTRDETSFNSTPQSTHPMQALSVGHLKSADNLTAHLPTVAPNEDHSMKSDVSTFQRRPGHGSIQSDQPNAAHNHSSIPTSRLRQETSIDEKEEEKVHGLKVNYQPASMTSSDIIFLDVMNSNKYSNEDHNQKGILHRKNFPISRNKTLFTNFSPDLYDQNKKQFTQNPAYNIAGSDQSILDINDSIFDYSATGSISEHSSISTNRPAVPVLSSSASSTHGSKSASPDEDEDESRMDQAANPVGIDERKPLHTKMTQRPEKGSWLENRDAGHHVNFSVPNKQIPLFSSRHSQKDACTDDGSMSFDIDDTILTVESIESDTERLKVQMSSGMRTNARINNMDDVKEHLNHLTFMYQQLFHLMRQNKKVQMPNAQPWNTAKSKGNSLKTAAHLERRKSMRSTILETKHNKKHFQRLEAHVVTLVRSVASLSNQVRTHTNAIKQIDILKEELQNLKTTLSDGTNCMGIPSLRNTQTEYERFRGWIPSLTNPRRVRKLTKFFGQEPPLLEIFLKKLGYERYLSNFSNEHIGMLELPYMTEDRLQSIGIPMGPRLRILQESQLCFRQENFNIYII